MRLLGRHILSANFVFRRESESPTRFWDRTGSSYTGLSPRHTACPAEVGNACGIECEAGSSPIPEAIWSLLQCLCPYRLARGLASHRLLQHLWRRLLLSERLWVTESERHLA